MILIDALYVNISGGKILLDYLIKEFNKSNLDVFYLFDSRIKEKHPIVKHQNFIYLEPSLMKRHRFYQENKHKFTKILCFGNLPPSVKTLATVYTYFHQPLFISIGKEIPLIQRMKLLFKTLILRNLVTNSNYWIVQSEFMKRSLINKFGLQNKIDAVKVIPFYPSISFEKKNNKRKKQLVYISSGEKHKNHERLLAAYTRFYDKNGTYELHLTVEKKFKFLHNLIGELQSKNYPIINHEYLNRQELKELYESSEYLIYPSLAESFGLGIVEALECGCKVIGSDLPYLHAVCVPSLSFNPESVEDMFISLNKIILGNIKPSEQLIFNKVEELINLFK